MRAMRGLLKGRDSGQLILYTRVQPLAQCGHGLRVAQSRIGKPDAGVLPEREQLLLAAERYLRCQSFDPLG